jgi:hypothetical protein
VYSDVFPCFSPVYVFHCSVICYNATVFGKQLFILHNVQVVQPVLEIKDYFCHFDVIVFYQVLRS